MRPPVEPLHFLILAALAASSSGCVRDELVSCGDLACPAGDVCNAAHGCVTSSQEAACAGLDEQAVCTYSGANAQSACYDGACLPVGCGNGIVDAGEQCDDGNRITGDGCSSDCRSNEHCGNGVVDPGEACDDGDFESHDGCDSRCLAEQEQWDVQPVGVDAGGYSTPSAFDETRRVLVSVGVGRLWELAGTSTTWTTIPSTAAPTSVVFDPGRGAVLASYADGSIFSWAPSNGAMVWTHVTDLPAAASTTATRLLVNRFDGVLHALVVTGSPSPSFLLYKLVAATWQPVTIPAPPSGYQGIGFDPETGDLVTVTPGSSSGTECFFTPSGTVWSCRSAPAGVRSLVPDPDGALIALSYSAPTKVTRRTPTGFSLIATRDAPATFVYRGYMDAGQLVTWAPGLRCAAAPVSGASLVCETFPSSGLIVAPPGEPPRIVSVQLKSSPGATWLVAPSGLVAQPTSGLPTTSLPSYGSVIDLTWTPSRGVVAHAEMSGSGPTVSQPFALDGTTWQPLPSPDHGRLVYLPHRQALASITPVSSASRNMPTFIQFLTEGSDSWSPPIATAFSAEIDAENCLLDSAAEDPMSHTVYVAEQCEEQLYRLDLDAAPPAFLPEPRHFYGALGADRRAAEVMVLDQDSGQLWTRRGDAAWRQDTTPPFDVPRSSPRIAYDAATGTLYMLADYDVGTVLLTRTWQSETPFESCADLAADLDGDGLSGCADPDCAWRSECAAAP